MKLDHIPPRKWWQRARWCVLESFDVEKVTIPKGFITDGVSTPWLLAWLVSPTGKAMDAAVLHDYLLSELKPWEDRGSADALFLAAMLHIGMAHWRAYTMFLAVRGFGMVKVWWCRL